MGSYMAKKPYKLVGQVIGDEDVSGMMEVKVHPGTIFKAKWSSDGKTVLVMITGNKVHEKSVVVACSVHQEKFKELTGGYFEEPGGKAPPRTEMKKPEEMSMIKRDDIGMLEEEKPKYIELLKPVWVNLESSTSLVKAYRDGKLKGQFRRGVFDKDMAYSVKHVYTTKTGNQVVCLNNGADFWDDEKESTFWLEVPLRELSDKFASALPGQTMEEIMEILNGAFTDVPFPESESEQKAEPQKPAFFADNPKAGKYA